MPSKGFVENIFSLTGRDLEKNIFVSCVLGGKVMLQAEVLPV